MKKLVFYHRLTKYTVDEKGRINGENQWIFKGVSFHHWRNGIDMNLQECFDDPKAMNGGLVWDIDHGATRQWAGQFCGRLPRVNGAYIEGES